MEKVDKTTLGIKLGETLKAYGKRLSTEFPKAGGVTLEQFVLLSILGKNDALIQQDLAELMNKDKSAVLRLVDALEQKGMATRRPDGRDRRKKLLSLTPKGTKALHKCFAREAEVMNEFLEGLDEKKLSALDAALSTIQANAKRSGAGN